MSDEVALEEKDKRGGGRARVILRAALITQDGRTEVRVKNISPSGAQVLANVTLVRDTDMLFVQGCSAVAARVVWVKGFSAGIEFYSPLPPAPSSNLPAGA